MNLPEKPELSPLQNISGDRNQSIGSMAGGSKAVGSVDGNVYFNENNQITLQAAERITSMFQLPPAVADFTGRGDELAQIEAALTGAGDVVSIVALSGMAGVGKSALALYVAHRLKAQFPDGQLYVNLQGADAQGMQPREPRDVLGDWLRAMGLKPREIPGELAALGERFRSQVAKQRVLMVLDNARDEAQVRALLPGGGGCAVLVTSRQVLAALAGVRAVRLGVLPAGDGVALLTKLVGDTRVTAEPGAAAEIVGLCGDLPLAIRIAGGVLRGKAHWGLAVDYLPLLRDEWGRLGELVQVGGEDVQASFNLSYRQLGAVDQGVFAVLGVLPGEFGTAVAAAVGEVEMQAVRESLERLVDAQLLEGMGRGRYRYHDLMRLYAKAMLGDEATGAAEGRVFEWCCQRAGYFANAFNPLRRRRLVAEQKGGTGDEAVDKATEQAFLQEALSWFVIERLNWLAAFEWGRAARNHLEVVAFAANVFNFFQIRGYWQDWEKTQVGALAAVRESNNLQGEGQSLMNLGNVYKTQGRWSDAINQHEQSLEIFRSLGDRHGEGQSLNNLGLVYKDQGRWADAIAQYKQSLEIFRSLGDRHGEGHTLYNLGSVYDAQGRWADAITLYEQSLEIFRNLGDHHDEGTTLTGLGTVYNDQGRWADAIALYEQSLEIFRSLGNHHGEGKTLGNLGSIYRTQGRWVDAITQHKKSLEIFRSLGDHHGESITLTCLGNVYQAQGLWADAITQYEQSLEIKRSLGDRHGEGNTLMNLGNVYQAQGLWADAITQHEQSLEILRSLGDRQGEGNTLGNLGNVYYSQGRWVDAIAQYEQSLEINRNLGDHHGESITLTCLGNVYYSQGRWADAINLYEQSLEIKRNLGDRHGEGNALNGLGNVYKAQSRWADAINLYEQSLEIKRNLGDRHGEGKTLNNLGSVYDSQGRWADVINLYKQSLEICRSLGDRHGEGNSLGNLGNVYYSQGRWADAITLYEQSLEIKRSLGDRHDEGNALNGLGNVYKAQGRWADAIAQYEQSLEIKRNLDDRHGEGTTLMNLGNLYQARVQPYKANQYWQEALTKLNPDSPEAKRLTKQLDNPLSAISPKQFLIGCLPQIALLIFAAVNLLRGHWLLALLILLAWASFIAIRIWRVRQGKA